MASDPHCAGLLLLAAAGLVTGLRLRSPSGLPLFHRLTTRQGTVLSARFAPDGETVVYSAEWAGRPLEVFSTWGTSAKSRPLGLTDAKVLAISRQGELAVTLRPLLTGGFTHVGTLARVPLAGGTPRELAEDVQDADWSPDGQSLAVVHWVEGRCRLEYPLGTLRYEPTPPAWVSRVRISPRGDRLAFLEHLAPHDVRGAAVIMDLQGRRRSASGEFSTLLGLSWDPDDEGLFVAGARAGAEQGIYKEAVGKERLMGRSANTVEIFDAGHGGRVIAGSSSVYTEIMGLPPGAGHERDLSEDERSFISDLSADGTMLVGTTQDPASGAAGSMFLKRTDGSPSINLGEGDALALSRDGRWVLARLFGGSAERLVVLPTGAGESRELPRGELDHYFEGDFFPDAHKVLFSAAAKGAGQRLFTQDVAGGPPRAISPEGYSLPSLGSSISPDGRRVTAFGPDGTPLLFPSEGGEPVPIAELEASHVPIAWTADGRGLFFYDAEADTARLQRLDLASGRVQLVRELVPAKPAGMVGHFRILVSADGRSYVYGYTRSRNILYRIDGLLR